MLWCDLTCKQSFLVSNFDNFDFCFLNTLLFNLTDPRVKFTMFCACIYIKSQRMTGLPPAS